MGAGGKFVTPIAILCAAISTFKRIQVRTVDKVPKKFLFTGRPFNSCNTLFWQAVEHPNQNKENVVYS